MVVVQIFYSLATFHKLSNIDRTMVDFTLNCSDIPMPVREDYPGHLISGGYRRAALAPLSNPGVAAYEKLIRKKNEDHCIELHSVSVCSVES